jgi:alpha-1,2-glucosyltransferase
VWLVALVSLAAGYALITQLEVGIGDEDVHRFQMSLFVQGQYELFEYVTVLPLYHWVVALFAKWTGLTSLNGFRLIHMLFAAGVIPAFFVLCRALYPRHAAMRTLQFMFIPLLFPLFFVTYTDLPALMFTLLMLERTFRQKYLWVAVFALVAVAMRQTNIIWAGFAGGLIALQVAREMAVGLRPGLSGGERGVMAPGYVREVLVRGKYLLLVLLLFVGFVAWNGGVALGDVEQHPVSLNLSNVYFCLMVAFVLFLPFNVGQLGNIRRLLRSHWWLLPVLLACFALYFTTYEHPHKYNTPELEFYRHNLFIHYTSDFTAIRILAFIPMAWMALSYVTAARASDYSGEMWLLVPFALLSFVPLPLIEPRYYLVYF